MVFLRRLEVDKLNCNKLGRGGSVGRSPYITSIARGQIAMADTVKLPRRSRGPKPQFFHDPAMDHMMAMIIALTGELAVAIERHDTLERLLDEAGLVTRNKVEAYRASAEVESERVARRDDLIARVFQILQEQAELAQTMGKSTRSERLSYIADDRGAILGAADDPALKPRRRKPAKKKAKSKRLAKKKPAGKATTKKPASKTKKKVRR
jgi:hypothetical protein